MKVEVERSAQGFHYRLVPDGDDTLLARPLWPDAKTNIELVRHEYDVVLPDAFESIHPDMHAAAIWRVVWPFTTSRLSLPFGVSDVFARFIETLHGVEVVSVDAALSPRELPREERPALLFSGGVDSLAAAMVMPETTAILSLDRIPHEEEGQTKETSLLDLVHPRALCETLRRSGRSVYSTKDDHEFMFRPYPTWHSQVWFLPAMYMADTLGLGPVATGDILDAVHIGGYHGGDVDRWGYRGPVEFEERPWERRRFHEEPGDAHSNPTRSQQRELSLVGLYPVKNVLGLTEVGSATVVNKGPFRGKAFSCYNPSPLNYCMRCDKCFKKILLDYIIEDREVPEELLEHFLGYPHLARIFQRPYFDWHHIWYYIFQKMKCSHPLAVELRRQTLEGPDLSFLEKWYPKTAVLIPAAYRAEVEHNLGRYVETMNAEEMARLENLRLPPLHAPPLPPLTGREKSPREPISAERIEALLGR